MTAISLAIQMALLMLVGYFAGQLRIVDDRFARSLASFVYYILFPCVVFRSMVRNFDFYKIADLSILIAISVISIGIMALVGLLVNKIIGKRDDLAGILMMNIMFTNFTYMAFPVMESLFGATGSLYISAYTLPVRVLFYIIAPLLFIKDHEQAEKADRRALLKNALKVLRSAPVLAVPVGIGFFVLNIPIADPIFKTIDSLANAATPMGMALCGVALAGIPLANFWKEKRIFIITALRLLIAPLIFTLIFALLNRFFQVDPLVIKVSIIYAALPAAASSTVIVMQARADAVRAAQCVLVTTIVSVVTLPLWVYVLDVLF